MIGYLKDWFNGNSYPRKITAVAEYKTGHELNREFGQKVAVYKRIPYHCRYFAERNGDNRYNIYLHFSALYIGAYSSQSVDSDVLKVKSGVSLGEALRTIRKMDDRAAKSTKHPPLWRSRANIRNVEKRLKSSGPMRH